MIINIEEFTERSNRWRHDRRMTHIRPGVVCSDGFEISIQASEFHYCHPRENYMRYYLSYELGFPNREEPLIMNWAEEADKPLKTVYGYVPTEIVQEMLDNHGGIVAMKWWFHPINRREPDHEPYPVEGRIDEDAFVEWNKYIDAVNEYDIEWEERMREIKAEEERIRQENERTS